MKYLWKEKKPLKHKLILIILLSILLFIVIGKVKTCIKAVEVSTQDEKYYNVDFNDFMEKVDNTYNGLYWAVGKISLFYNPYNHVADNGPNKKLLSTYDGDTIYYRFQPLGTEGVPYKLHFDIYDRHDDLASSFSIELSASHSVNYGDIYGDGLEELSEIPLYFVITGGNNSFDFDIYKYHSAPDGMHLLISTSNQDASRIDTTTGAYFYTGIYDQNILYTYAFFNIQGVNAYTYNYDLESIVNNEDFINSYGDNNESDYIELIRKTAYSAGIYDGGTSAYETGYDDGYDDGYTTGARVTQPQAFESGYEKGKAEGATTQFYNNTFFGWIKGIFTAITGFLSIGIGTDFTIGHLLVIPLAITLCWAIFKLMRGGGS